MIARDKGWKKMWVEGDSKLVIGAMKGGSIQNWRLEVITEAAKSLSIKFDNVHFLHIGRKGNRVAN